MKLEGELLGRDRGWRRWGECVVVIAMAGCGLGRATRCVRPADATLREGVRAHDDTEALTDYHGALARSAHASYVGLRGRTRPRRTEAASRARRLCVQRAVPIASL